MSNYFTNIKPGPIIKYMTFATLMLNTATYIIKENTKKIKEETLSNRTPWLQGAIEDTELYAQEMSKRSKIID